MNSPVLTFLLTSRLLIPVWSYWILGVVALLVGYYWFNRLAESIPKPQTTGNLYRWVIPFTVAAGIGFILVQFIRGSTHYQVMTEWNPIDRAFWIIISLLLFPRFIPKR